MKWRSISFFLLLAGCKVGPNYQIPKMQMPEAFLQQMDAEVSQRENLYRWWDFWEDPVLSATVEEVVRDNFTIQIAIEKILQARSYYRIESSYLAPEIDLLATATRSRYSQNVFTTSTSAESIENGTNPTSPRGSIFGPALQNFFQIGFDAVWELDIFGKLRRGQEAAWDEWGAVQMQAQDVLLTMISEAVHQYIMIRSLQQQIRILQKKIDTARRIDVLWSMLEESGLESQRPVARAAMNLQEMQGQLPVAHTSLEQSIYALAVLLGKQPEAVAQTFSREGSIPSGYARVPAGLPSDLLRRRPDIRSAERKLAAATARIGVAVADYFPSISLTGTGYGYESNQQNNWLVPSARYWSIGPTINWNLIDFGKTRAQVAMAKSERKEAFLQYEQTIITSLQDVEGALVAYFDEQVRYGLLEQEKLAAESLYCMTQDMYMAGLISEIQALDALNTALDTELKCIQSQQALANDIVAIYKALGGEWECLPTP